MHILIYGALQHQDNGKAAFQGFAKRNLEGFEMLLTSSN